MSGRTEAEKFLKTLEPKGDKFTFQTFDDTPAKRKVLVRVLHGTLAEHWDTLVKLNKAGAGVYITVNETDLKGREANNITRVRSVFIDLDGAPLGPVLKFKPAPQIIVESSPKRWHAYWLVKDFPLDKKEYRNAQQRLIKKFNSDKAIKDLPRVLRLPGFIHQKGKPFEVRITKINNAKPYKAEQFFGQEETRAKTNDYHIPEPVDITAINLALDVIPSDSYPVWFEVGCALAYELKDKGYELFDRWSRKSDKYNKDICEMKWQECRKISEFKVGTIYHYANEVDPHWRDAGDIPVDATIEDFVAFLPSHNYIYLPTGQSWPASSVNSRLPKQVSGAKRLTASAWLDRHRKVEGMTWSPGDPQLIDGRVARDQGGWIEKLGVTCLNLYYPPIVQLGDAGRATPWVNLVHKIFPKDAIHIINFLAHRVQRPGEKINHALILGGDQGIGKDTILEPVKHAIGHWNFAEVSPQAVISRFNAHIKSVICRISEARDLGGEFKSWDFYEHLKTLTASPPDMLQCEEKHMKKYAVANVTGVIITTNYKSGGIYLPPSDRRTYVAWSDLKRDEFPLDYWKDLWAWYKNGGFAQVAGFLHAYDLRRFDPKEPPAQTEAFKDIVEANMPMENEDFGIVLNKLNRPGAITIGMLIEATPSHSFAQWLEDRKNARAIVHRLEASGYVPIRNLDTPDGRWRYRVTSKKNSGVEKNEQREVKIYTKADFTVPQRISAARALVQQLQRDGLFLIHIRDE